MRSQDLLTVSEVSARSGFAASALRFYEREGLVRATRTSGNQRRYERSVLRRLAFIRAARNVGLSLPEVAAALATLPDGRTPTRADWTRLSRTWRHRLDDQIAALHIGSGYGLHWDDLDADFTIGGLLAGRFGTASYMEAFRERLRTAA